MSPLEVNDRLMIPEEYLRYLSSRSSGPGGQHVNKTSTRITLVFDLLNCPAFDDDQKKRILKRLAGYADKEGRIHITSQRCRSQHANRLDAGQRLAGLLAKAVKPPVKRRKTAVPKAAVRKRLEHKRQRSTLKKLRANKNKD